MGRRQLLSGSMTGVLPLVSPFSWGSVAGSHASSSRCLQIPRWHSETCCLTRFCLCSLEMSPGSATPLAAPLILKGHLYQLSNRCCIAKTDEAHTYPPKQGRYKPSLWLELDLVYFKKANLLAMSWGKLDICGLHTFYGLAESFWCIVSPKALSFCCFTSCELSYPEGVVKNEIWKANQKTSWMTNISDCYRKRHPLTC